VRELAVGMAAAREKGLPHQREHADHLKPHLEQHGPDEATVTLSLTDDIYLRSYNWARWQLGIPLPGECGHTNLAMTSGTPGSSIGGRWPSQPLTSRH
jgi:hypothetical protein